MESSEGKCDEIGFPSSFLFYIYFMLKSFCHIGDVGKITDARIPPPPGRVKDRVGMRTGGRVRSWLLRGNDIFVKVPA